MVRLSSLRVSMPSEPCPAAGQKCMRVKTFANPLGLFKAVEAGGGEKDGIDLAFSQLAQAGIDIAAKFDGFDIGAEG